MSTPSQVFCGSVDGTIAISWGLVSAPSATLAGLDLYEKLTKPKLESVEKETEEMKSDVYTYDEKVAEKKNKNEETWYVRFLQFFFSGISLKWWNKVSMTSQLVYITFLFIVDSMCWLSIFCDKMNVLWLCLNFQKIQKQIYCWCILCIILWHSSLDAV